MTTTKRDYNGFPIAEQTSTPRDPFADIVRKRVEDDLINAMLLIERDGTCRVYVHFDLASGTKQIDGRGPTPREALANLATQLLDIYEGRTKLVEPPAPKREWKTRVSSDIQEAFEKGVIKIPPAEILNEGKSVPFGIVRETYVDPETNLRMAVVDLHCGGVARVAV